MTLLLASSLNVKISYVVQPEVQRNKARLDGFCASVLKTLEDNVTTWPNCTKSYPISYSSAAGRRPIKTRDARQAMLPDKCSEALRGKGGGQPCSMMQLEAQPILWDKSHHDIFRFCCYDPHSSQIALAWEDLGQVNFLNNGTWGCVYTPSNTTRSKRTYNTRINFIPAIPTIRLFVLPTPQWSQ